MSSFIRTNTFFTLVFMRKHLAYSALLLLVSFSINISIAQPTSRSLPTDKEIEKRNRKEKFSRDTIFYSNGNILATGKQKSIMKYQGCLGLWPYRVKKRKWVFYTMEGNVQKIYWYRKNKIRRQKSFSELN